MFKFIPESLSVFSIVSVDLADLTLYTLFTLYKVVYTHSPFFFLLLMVLLQGVVKIACHILAHLAEL